ncbi:hypothetical protein EsDP_00001008 [Epichloe bromicola]|uniref:Uncharacterized protein n=1 Tax=Epichloe bromicola TaxID=79588 RepID=A0ABQ0CGM7_9HYPO
MPGPSWRTSALSATSEAVCGRLQSEDARILLALLSFFSTLDKIPANLLSRGTAPCKRWTSQGGIEEVDANHMGLPPELQALLSDTTRLEHSFRTLELSSAVTKHHDQTYTIDNTVTSHIHERLPAEDLCFWRHQAVVVVYRAVPWKYIEPVVPNAKLFLPHLKHAVQELQDICETLPANTRIDLALTLLESSRYSNLSWKRWVTKQAEIVSRGLDDSYLESRITESQTLINRIAGASIQPANSNSDSLQRWAHSTTDKRMQYAIGQATIQRSLDCMQVDDLFTARALLENLSLVHHNSSLMERVIIFRKDMLLGRILRFLGEFEASRVHLESARQTADQFKDIVFDEDFRDLGCDYADTLRELDHARPAERQLRAEIMRQDRLDRSLRKSILELSLSEALFAQGRLDEAEELCIEIESRAGLLKMERLRLSVTRAKLRHVQSDYEGAFNHWSSAMAAVGKYKLTGGSTSQIIVMSICDTLSELGHAQLMQQSLQQARTLGNLVKPGRAEYWIAGMRHWLEFLQSRSFRSHM